MWYDVNKNAMPEDGFYLVRCPNYNAGNHQVANWDNNIFSWEIEGDDTVDMFVTHWMDIPPLRQPEKKSIQTKKKK